MGKNRKHAGWIGDPCRNSLCCFVLVAASLSGAGPARAGDQESANLDACREQFKTGRYTECLQSVRKALEDGVYAGDWRTLEVESLMALGRYDEAARSVDAALRGYRPDVRLLQVAHEAYLHNNQSEEAAAALQIAYRLAAYRRFEYLSGPEAVALGQCLLLLGIEPRVVLRDFYNRVMQSDPNCREAYLAAGSLAIAKEDYELAAQRYTEALKRFGDDPDVHYGLAQAFYQSDRKAMLASLDAALHINPNHAPALVLLAEHQIDCEDYEGAGRSLDRALAVNPWHPDAWACRAVLACFANDPNAVAACRAKALKFWRTNPQVDHLIGRKLSQNYRFAEGAGYQRRALAFDPNYLPAKIQLAQDLLRLGEEQQGWVLADEVNTKDPYNVEAYNLVNLHDALSQFKTLSEDGFVVRMDEREAAVYGDKVVELLRRAKSTLCDKYGLQVDGEVVVELFPNQQDFAVRTFGMPGGDGYLGVCFGKVITANSPKAARPANWQAMLWHEFCHVVTLTLTGNKMPRWLSEGISVYEESQADPTWGQQMNPQYREMILGGELTPVGSLSGAFMSPPTPMHLQFAYYESALVVEFLVERYGFASLKAILADLAEGTEINAAIAAHAGRLDKVEKEFEAFARARAESRAPAADWEQPSREVVDPADREAVDRWLADHPNSYWALNARAGYLIADGQWEQAKTPLRRLISLYPSYTGQDNAYRLLAGVHRSLGETEQEAEVLGKLAAASGDAADAYGRLMEIGMERGNWARVAENGRKYLATYPLLSTAYWRLARAGEELGRPEQAIDSYQRLLLLDPADPVDVHYRLARLLQHRDPAAAKRHVLEALADAPRFRQGHQLLLAILNEQRTAGEAQP
jgi:tetratricopeptide (TPR) repeat protein